MPHLRLLAYVLSLLAILSALLAASDFAVAHLCNQPHFAGTETGSASDIELLRD